VGKPRKVFKFPHDGTFIWRREVPYENKALGTYPLYSHNKGKWVLNSSKAWEAQDNERSI